MSSRIKRRYVPYDCPFVLLDRHLATRYVHARFEPIPKRHPSRSPTFFQIDYRTIPPVSGVLHPTVEEPSVSFLDYLYVWLKWRRFILWMVGISSALALIVSLLLPKTYMASTTILPPKPETPAGLAGFSAVTASLDVFGLGKTQEVDTYVALLESRRVQESAIRTFNLQKYFEKETMDETLTAFSSTVDVTVTKENTVTLSVIHEDSVQAAAIANFMIDELDRINKTLANEQAHSNRVFIEGRLANTHEQLRLSEEAMKTYQETHRTLGLSEENRAAIIAGAQIEAQVMALEIQQESLQKNFGATHPVLQGLSAEIDAAKHRLEGLPAVGLDLARLFREVEIQTRVLTFLLPQYEQAKIQEARDTPTIQVIDRAVPPQRKYAPKRLFIVAGAAISSLILSLFLTLGLNTLGESRINRTATGRKVDKILEEWRAFRGKSA